MVWMQEVLGIKGFREPSILGDTQYGGDVRAMMNLGNE